VEGLTLFGVFVAGFATFLSPCIIPLMPMYISYITGNTDGNAPKKEVIYGSMWFALGLMFVYGLLGLTATAIGRFLFMNSDLFRQIGGIVLILLGLFHSGLIKFNFFESDKKFTFRILKNKQLNAFLLGATFSFGWTPCISPILGSILVLAAGSNTMYTGLIYMIIFSLGFAVPFIVTGVFVDEIMKRLHLYDKSMKWIKIVTGLLIALMGVLVYFNYIGKLLTIFE
jgi:cytochrome c-type biogenesis protein